VIAPMTFASRFLSSVTNVAAVQENVDRLAVTP
jgi:hypothetical protein